MTDGLEVASGTIHHIELWVPDLGRAIGGYEVELVSLSLWIFRHNRSRQGCHVHCLELAGGEVRDQ
jgi:hypothetical protein